MIKKVLGFLLLVSLSLTLVGCQPNVTLDVKDTELTIIANQEVTIPVTSDDAKGLDVVSGDDTILNVKQVNDNEIIIEGLIEGETTLTITSKSRTSVNHEMTIKVLKDIDITYGDESIDLTVGDTFRVDVTSNDTNLTFDTSSNEIFVVDQEGNVTAKQEGTATLTVTSEYNNDVTLDITINVNKKVDINVERDEYILVVGDVIKVNVTSNDDVTFESQTLEVFTVDEEGNITAKKFGQGTLRVYSESQSNVYVDVPVNVFKYTTGLTIEGPNQIVVDMDAALTINSEPLGAYEGVTWSSSDETVLTIDENGIMTGTGVGITTVVATSLLDDTIKDTYDVEVINVVVVDHTKQTGDTYDYNGVALVHGEKLYTTINEALTNVTAGTKIIVAEGTYSENVNLSLGGLVLEGINNAKLNGTLSITASNITINNMIFTGEAKITATGDISNIVLSNNSTDAVTTSTGTFVEISGVTDVEVINNTFSSLSIDAVLIKDFVDGLYLVKDNVFDTVERAVLFEAVGDYAITTEINILWNEFNNVNQAFVFDMVSDNENQLDIEAYARFNKVSFNNKGAVVNEGNLVDLTLNYWGSETLDYANFDNVDHALLRGYYVDADSVMIEDNYDVRIPIIIEITNPITEIMIGETHTVEYTVLPMDMVNPYIRFITSNSKALGVSNDGVLTPKISGVATITVRSGYNSKLKTTMDVNIVTTPGIELTSDHVMNNLMVGDDFNLTANAFPISSADEAITFTSSDQNIATINQNGYVDVIGTGLVTLKASFTNDPSVYTEFTIYVYDELNASNLLDYLTMNQVIYTTRHDWTAYGYQGNYEDTRYESVSRYYFDDVEINTSKLVPPYYAIRPAEPMNVLPEDVRYNEDNIHWVVVHDTASSATGSNALAHANYLYNNAVNQKELWVSWHYTIDDTYVYQHLPENERAFHAGDGSTPVGSGSYLGGGNRNGVGIEMAINQDGDMYRTWQRTAKLVVDILIRNNLPTSQQVYHNDFSGKDCPRTLRNAGLVPLFEEFVEIEYYVRTNHPNAVITLESNNAEYVDDYGRVIKLPDRAMTVSYTITVTENGMTESRVFYAYLPGTVH